MPGIKVSNFFRMSISSTYRRQTFGVILIPLLVIFSGDWISTSAQTIDSLWQVSLDKFDRNDFNGVVEDLNRLLQLDPDFNEALYNRGVAKLSLGDREGACSDMELARSSGLEENLDYINYVCDDDVIRNYMIREYYDNLKVLPENGYRPVYGRADSLRGALRPERTCFDVFFYDLAIRINPKRKKIEGSNQIHFHVIQACQRIQIDLFNNLKIKSITWEGKVLDFSREYNAVFVDFPEILNPGEDQVLKVQYAGSPVIAENPPWEGGLVWDTDDDGNFFSGVACEYLGASCWWPNKDHLSDKADSILITLEVPAGYMAVSNGTLRKVIETERKYDSYSWFVSYPINNYNVTFYLGKYEYFNDFLVADQDTLTLKYYVMQKNLEKAKDHFRQTREVLDFYSRTFGPYPFPRDGFGLVESPYEGMEHQSAIAYGNEYSNSGYRNERFDYIIVHEAAHEWWGNSVTASDMADIWIHEGFATFSEYLFLEEKEGINEYLYQLNRNTQYIFNIWPLVQHRDVNENTFASNDVYNKGAMMLHCLRCCMNDDSLFFRLLREFASLYRYKVVTSDDFIAFVNRYTSLDYTPFFRKFLYDTRLPILAYRFRLDSGNLVINYRWTGVDVGFFMPVGIETSQGEAVRLEATTDWKEIVLQDVSYFNFYNPWKGYEGCPANIYTYYGTRCENL